MGSRVKEFREMRNMSQEELAEKSGISRGTISAIETGKAENATSKTLLKIAEALETTVDKIFFSPSV